MNSPSTLLDMEAENLVFDSFVHCCLMFLPYPLPYNQLVSFPLSMEFNNLAKIQLVFAHKFLLVLSPFLLKLVFLEKPTIA